MHKSTTRNPVVSEEESHERQFRSFNFRRPEVLSREQLRGLEQRLEGFCRAASTVLAQYMQKPVEVTLQKVRNTVYESLFEKASSEGGRSKHLYGFFRTSGGGGLPGVLSFSRDLLYAMIEHLMGGTGYTPQAARPLTDFERLMVMDIGNRLLKRLADALAEVIPMDPDIQVVQEEPRLLPRVFAGDDPFLRQTYEVDLGDCRGYLTLSMPYRVLRPHLARLKTMPAQSAAPRLKDEELRRFDDYDTLPLDLVAEMAPVQVTLGTLLKLKPGDVVPVDPRSARNVLVRVDDSPRFLGRPGLLGDRLVVEVTQLVEEEAAHGDVCWPV